MKRLIFILLYIWQLPQNLAGLLLRLAYHRDGKCVYKGKFVGVDDRFVSNKAGDKTHNGISLGVYIILEKHDLDSLRHEYGHCRQSEILGWLYLPVIGICSGVHNLVHRYKEAHNLPRRNYYRFWCEAWANRLAGIPEYGLDGA